MYSIIPEVWTIQACKVFQVHWHTRGDITGAEEYSGCSRLNLEYSRVLTHDPTLLLFWLL